MTGDGAEVLVATSLEVHRQRRGATGRVDLRRDLAGTRVGGAALVARADLEVVGQVALVRDLERDRAGLDGLRREREGELLRRGDRDVHRGRLRGGAGKGRNRGED